MAIFYRPSGPARCWPCILFVVFLATTLNLNASSLRGELISDMKDPSRFLNFNGSLKFPISDAYSTRTESEFYANADQLCANPPVITFISGDGLNCEGDTDGNVLITVSGGTPFSGPYPYQFDWDWSETGGNDDFSCSCPSIEYEDLSNLGAGTYYVTVTDAAGCTATAQAQVTEPLQAITISGSDIELDCFGNADGQMDITVTGGTPDPFNGGYVYDWDFDGTGGNDDMGGPPDVTDDDQNPTDLGPGVYTVTVTDFLGCTQVMSFSVTEPPELTASVSSEDVECAGEASGSADLDVQGGTAPFNFDWDNDGTGDNDDPEDLSDVAAGIYNVTVTDDKGCTATATIEITEPSEAVQASVTGFDIDCFGAGNGSIDLTPSGGTGNFVFDWSNDGTGDNDDPEDLNDVEPGSYSVTVTDANGCTAVASVDINEPPEITTDLDTSICTGGSLIIGGEVFDESNSSGMVVLTAANGCDSTVTINLSFDPPPTSDETYEGCEGDGYEVVVNGTVYNESNPSGSETLTTAEGCDSIVNISLTFTPGVTGEETYEGCEGDGYEVTVGNVVFNEGNSTGEVTLTSQDGCDSVVTVTLVFNPPTENTISNEGCTGDGFEIVVNGTTYNESNPSGVEVIQNGNGCDSTITIDLQFGSPSDTSITYQGCQGDGYSVNVNGTLYNESNPTGTEVATNSDGCDSTITVSLTFTPPIEENITYDGCTGDDYSITVNGTIYDEDNTSGQEIMTSVATGCDSIVNINLSFSDQTSGMETYDGCTGDGYQVTVNGRVYNEGNPTGEETLTSSGGCDSVVTIELNFNQPTTGEVLYDGCEGDGYFVIINGTSYNQNNTDGVEVIQNAAGCDSVITIDLNFNPTSESFITYEGCEGDGHSVLVNGIVYNEINPNGVETTTNSGGCDSTINIDLIFHPNTEQTINHQGCVGDGYSIVVNGNVYDENNPVGTEAMVSAHGCDSVVNINLVFSDGIITNIDSTLCSGGQIEVGGIVFDADYPSGEVDLVASGGCDSTVVVNLDFDDPLTGLEEYQGCTGDGYFVVVNGVVYNEGNPTGTEFMTTPGGCDSVVTVNLEFGDNIIVEIDTTLCTGEFIEVNGNVYDVDNPTGTEIIQGPGCDSIVEIIIEFLSASESFVDYEGCEGDGFEVTVNGVIYNESNPVGEEFIGSGSGCDSVVYIDLVFHEAVYDTIEYQGCFGDGNSIVVNGTVYDELNPTGTEWMTGPTGCDSVITVEMTFGDTVVANYEYVGCEGDGFEIQIGSGTYNESNPIGTEAFVSDNGCDSVLQISLIFLPPVITTLESNLCTGDSLIINGTVYNEDNPIGTETISTSSCDSIINISLTFTDAINSEVTYSGCNGDGYEVVVNGTVYGESNPSGQEVLLSSAGCDSIVSIQLSFEECCTAITVDDFGTICDGDTYAFGGQTLSNAGVYRDTIFDALGPGCDSIVVLTLEVVDAISSNVSKVICEGDAIDFYGSALTLSGTYSHTIPGGASTGCDSIVNLELQVEDIPSADAGSAEMITCVNNSTTLSGVGSAANTKWTGPDIAGEHNGAQVTVGVPGWYYFICTSPNGCVASDSVLVEAADDVPVINGLSDGHLDCAHDSVQVWAEFSGSNVMFEWTGPGTPDGQVEIFNFMTAAAGIYTVTAIDMVSYCASATDTIEILDLTEEIQAVITGDSVITCETGTVTLDASGSSVGENTTLTWMNQDGDVLGHDMYPEIASPGMYYLMVEDTMTSCSGNASFMVMADQNVPICDAGDNKQLTCAIDMVTLEASTIAGQDVEFFWSGPAGGIVGSETGSAIQAILPGIYYLTTVDTANMCQSTDSVIVMENLDTPDAYAGSDDELTCAEAVATLDASGSSGNGELAFAWSGPAVNGVDSSITLEVDLPGDYILTVMNLETGCTASDTVRVTQLEGIDGAIVEFNSPTCYGYLDGMILIDEVLGGTPPYSIAINGSTIDDISLDTLIAGSYDVLVVDDKGCKWSTTVELDEGTLATVSAGPDVSIEIGDMAQLSIETNVPADMLDSIIWTPGELLTCDDCIEPSVRPVTNTTFTVTIVTTEGCWATDNISVFVEEEVKYFVPNVFTPNADGVNDDFTLYANDEPVTIEEMLIYDRWGEQVFRNDNFKSNDPSMGWDGSFRGTTLQPGVYTYVFRVAERTGAESSVVSGDVTIIR